jgi:hypothetical protein
VNYSLEWLNDESLKGGQELNTLWGDSTNSLVENSDGTGKWIFSAGSMAPYPQSDLYAPRSETWGHEGCLAQYTYGMYGIFAPDLHGIVLNTTRSNGTISITVALTNSGLVIAPASQIDTAGLVVGSDSYVCTSSMPIPLGTVFTSGQTKKTATLTFPSSVGSSGATVILKLTAQSIYDNEGHSLGGIAVTLP